MCLCFDMTPQLVRSHPKVEENCNQVAIMHGPVVYCLESVDLPPGVDLSDVFIPRDVKLKPKFATDILGGTIILRGKLRVVQKKNDGVFYHDLEMEGGEKIKVKLIPYFAWNNRGETEMTVWLPVM